MCETNDPEPTVCRAATPPKAAGTVTGQDRISVPYAKVSCAMRQLAIDRISAFLQGPPAPANGTRKRLAQTRVAFGVVQHSLHMTPTIECAGRAGDSQEQDSTGPGVHAREEQWLCRQF